VKALGAVSVVMAARNAQDTIAEALRAALAAGAPEVIVVANDCADDTAGVAQSVLGSRGCVLQTRLGGQAYARALGVRAAHGDYVAFADADDLSEPCRFERHAAMLDADLGLSGVGGQCLLYNQVSSWQSNLFEDPLHVEADLLMRVPLFLGAGMVRRQVLLNRPYPPMSVAGDWYWLIRMSGDGHRFANDPRVALRYRQHEHNVTAVARGVETFKTPFASIQAGLLLERGVVLTDCDLELFVRSGRSVYKLFSQISDVAPHEIPRLVDIYDRVVRQSPMHLRPATRCVLNKHLEWLETQQSSMRAETRAAHC
jgi:glycosyltransferase involved in cell wall biosynthesis